MIKKLLDLIKGGTYVSEKLVDVLNFEGIIPACARYDEEHYRFQVLVFRVSISRDSQWVKPIITWTYEVTPKTKHTIPIDRRLGTIHVSESISRMEFKDATSATDAVDKYLEWIRSQRVEFEKTYNASLG